MIKGNHWGKKLKKKWTKQNDIYRVKGAMIGV